MLQKGMSVTEITQSNQVLAGIFRVSNVQRQAKSNGEPYWSFKLGDASGSIVAKRWPSNRVLTPQELPEGSYAEVTGVSNTFANMMQLRIDSIRVLSDKEAAELDIREFTPASPYDGDACTREVLELADRETAQTPWNRLIHAFFDVPDNRKAFAWGSAAKCVHHAGVGGLAAHTLEVCKTCLAIASVYEDIDRPALVTAALFHDIGKLQEMETTGFETTYTVPGYLMGHMVLGVAMLAPFCRQAELPTALEQHFTHLILSHHGTVEFGAVTPPATKEAIILAEADMLSAKLNCMAAAVSKLAEGEIEAKISLGLTGRAYNRLSTKQVCESASMQGTPAQPAPAASSGQCQRKAHPQAQSPAPHPAPAARTTSRPTTQTMQQTTAQTARPAAPQTHAAGHAANDTPPWDDNDDYLSSLAEADDMDFGQQEIPPQPEGGASSWQARGAQHPSAAKNTGVKSQGGKKDASGSLASFF